MPVLSSILNSQDGWINLRGSGYIYPLQAEATLHADPEYIDQLDTVLDFGCADGSLLEPLPNASELGVEVNSASGTKAGARNFSVHDWLDSLEEGPVDSTLSSDVLKHILNPPQELTAPHRVAKTGAFCRLPVGAPIRTGYFPIPNHHLYTWSSRLLANLLENRVVRGQRR